MKPNAILRQRVLTVLMARMPDSTFKTTVSGWRLLAVEETPALMVYLDEGELTSLYLDEHDAWQGVLTVSVYLGAGTTDEQLDRLGDKVLQALPDHYRFPRLATLHRRGFRYERSEEGTYRALHFTHTYQME
ncbi:phage tail terminator protein [Vibrio sp. La 4.2.2]|uniref:phage tail terminator protein n=1 Tax=Vibrio sp. La 4.2.2 TaxID=2998830 RepID=UPI0022CDE280|nr:phage tail terminator protein [Vibrio sp. La 4.2.2]MDA0107826.1 phage tail terminator protein [Vibrio sp. La 4.2.2]